MVLIVNEMRTSAAQLTFTLGVAEVGDNALFGARKLLFDQNMAMWTTLNAVADSHTPRLKIASTQVPEAAMTFGANDHSSAQKCRDERRYNERYPEDREKRYKGKQILR